MLTASAWLPLSVAAAASGLAAIGCEVIAERRGTRPPAFLLLKPLTTLLIAATLFTGGAPDARLVAAFAFALIGDIALMFAGDRAFLAGLGSFFVAHLLLVAAFLGDRGWAPVPLWSLGFVLYALALFAWLLPKTGALRWPTLAYGVVLTAMVLVSAAAQAAEPSRLHLLTLAGAILFALSDSALAVRQFVGPYRAAQPLILLTYWLAIGLIAAARP